VFLVKFWGTRGSIPTPGWQTRRYGGNTSCLAVNIDDSLFVCDGGTGLRELGLELVKDPQKEHRVHMFFSHPHWDHIQGFPFFVPVYKENNTVFVYGRKEEDTAYFELISGQMQSDYFPVEFSELVADIRPAFLEEGGKEIEGVKISWCKQFHPGGSLAYRFEKDGRTMVYATDNELDLTIENKEEVEDNPAALRKVSRRYIDFIRDADLLIGDGQYLDREYDQKIGWGHSRATTLVDAAIEANVKQLAIFHHDPMHDDETVDEKVEICRRRAALADSDIIVFGAREKVALRLDYD
jgi:phosphoribosyl 1,2-cyclic phosphodiesterase